MSVAPRGSSWQAHFRHKGVRYRRQFETELAAKQWEADSLAALLRGDLPTLGEQSVRAAAFQGGKPYTLKELLDWVEKTRWMHQRSHKTSMINARDAIEILGETTPISAVDKMALGRLVITLQERGLALATINRKLTSLMTMLKDAFELDIITKVPKHRNFKESEGRIRRFTQEEERMVLGYFALIADQDMEDYTVISLDAGLRQEEVLHLAVDQTVDADYVKVFGTDAKGKRSRAVPVTPRVAATIKRRREIYPKGLLFPDLDADKIRKQWDKVRGALEMTRDPNFVPHILRHEFCSRLAELGVPVQVIQKLAGHAQIATTMRYIHLSPNALKTAINQLAIHNAVDVKGAIQSPPAVATSVPQGGHMPFGAGYAAGTERNVTY